MPASRPALWERAFPGDDSAQEMLRLAQGLVDGSEDTDVSARRAFWLWYLDKAIPAVLAGYPCPETLARADRQARTSLTDPPTVGAEPFRLDPHRFALTRTEPPVAYTNSSQWVNVSLFLTSRTTSFLVSFAPGGTG